MAALRTAGCVFAEAEAGLLLEAAGGSPSRLDALLERRCAGHPLEQVVGWAGFFGHRIELTPGVFVPRRRSEFLVAEAIRRLPDRSPVIVLDLCCGSGALGLGVALSRPGVELHASDIDAAAVSCARGNLARLTSSPPPEVYAGSLFDPVPERLRGCVDVLLANAPYVPSEEITFLPPEARLHEPPGALDGGADGLALHRQVAATALEWLRPGGALLIETSGRQSPVAAAFFRDAGLAAAIVTDESLEATVVVGVLPSYTSTRD